jgi:hypothetical protein
MALNLVFLLEEPSMRDLLDQLLPRILPSGVYFQTIPHRGKTDLRKSIPKKLKAWQIPNTRFIIVHDQDSHDCQQLKQELLAVCKAAGRDDVLVRIVCQELEAWYFGDLKAVEQAFAVKGLQSLADKKAYRNPDLIPKPSAELAKRIPSFQKGLAAQLIPVHMDIEHNRSKSFQNLITGLQTLCHA